VIKLKLKTHKCYQADSYEMISKLQSCGMEQNQDGSLSKSRRYGHVGCAVSQIMDFDKAESLE